MDNRKQYTHNFSSGDPEIFIWVKKSWSGGGGGGLTDFLQDK